MEKYEELIVNVAAAAKDNRIDDIVNILESDWVEYVRENVDMGDVESRSEAIKQLNKTSDSYIEKVTLDVADVLAQTMESDQIDEIVALVESTLTAEKENFAIDMYDAIADEAAYNRDPYSYYGVKRSDFF